MSLPSCASFRHESVVPLWWLPLIGGVRLADGPLLQLLRSVVLFIVPCVQNDYFEGGSFAIPDADTVIAAVNGLRDKHFDMVFVCTTHHALNHSGFAANNPVRWCCIYEFCCPPRRLRGYVTLISVAFTCAT